jgi:RES domain-containing protein
VTTCFRLSSGRHPANVGIGAALHGGRWNPKGVEAIYAAATISLAAMEVMVHYAVLPRDFVATEIHIPATVAIEMVSPQGLPPGWNAPSPPVATQNFGRMWTTELWSAVLRVPSAIVPAEWIYVLNPRHPDFQRIEFLPPSPFGFDLRLK